MEYMSSAEDFIRFAAKVFIIALIGVFILFAFVVLVNLDSIDEERIRSTKAQIVEIKKAIKFFEMDNGRLPTTEEGLSILTTTNQKGNSYIPEIKPDAWNRRLHYFSDGKTYKIFSYGADGKNGGSGYDADIFVSGKQENEKK